MTRGDGDLSGFREIAVVLGGGLERDGAPTAPTTARADAAATLAMGRGVAIVVSGSHGDGARPRRTEAELMAERIRDRGVDPSRIFVEDASRDTVTNAAFVAERFLAALTPRRLIIVTSPFHMARALATFALVLGPEWPLEAHASAPAPGDDQRGLTEALYLSRTRALLEGLAAGEIGRIAAHVRATLADRVSDATA